MLWGEVKEQEQMAKATRLLTRLLKKSNKRGISCFISSNLMALYFQFRKSNNLQLFGNPDLKKGAYARVAFPPFSL